MRVGMNQSFVIADIPGIIEGASEGAGLGIQFLKHLSRTRLLLHIIDMQPYDGSDAVDEARTVIKELDNFSHELAKKPRWLILNKSDLLSEDKLKDKQDDIIQRLNWKGPVYTISALSKNGTEALVFDIMKQLELDRELESEREQQLSNSHLSNAIEQNNRDDAPDNHAADDNT